ncbi:MAG: hypothetical protein HFE83_02430 [Lachnospiraceae bacterium]|jgi:hypothetical protein|nr:hypothetical protein [Lachnospiraceae bacterium]
MAEAILLKGGGGGVASDELTASLGDVLKGKTAVTSDSGDEAAAGTLELTGDAGVSQVLTGKTYYSTNAKQKQTGTMPNQGAKTAALNCGGSYTIPAGYHNGSGKVTANTLASQTDANAAAANILKGKTAWVKGTKITGTMTVNSLTSFSAAVASGSAITLSWKVPAAATGKPFSGVHVRYKTGSAPTSVTDGTAIYTGAGSATTAGATSTATVTLPALSTKYYFAAWPYATIDGAASYGNKMTAEATTAGASTQTIKSSTTYTILAGFSKMDLFAVGGGSSGDYGWGSTGGGGGNAGFTKTVKNVAISPGQKLAITIGAGGAAAKYEGNTNYANQGGTTTVVRSGTTLISAAGGSRNSGEIDKTNTSAVFFGNGGSGGGAGAYTKSGSTVQANTGGSNGSAGNPISGTPFGYSYPGKGQGSTTRAFGDSNGTLYAGGGGGAGKSGGYSTHTNNKPTTAGAAGGEGGGGKGAGKNGSTLYNSTAGTANTGGGGGGGCTNYNSYYGSAGGSGLVLIKLHK